MLKLFRHFQKLAPCVIILQKWDTQAELEAEDAGNMLKYGFLGKGEN